MAFGGMKTVPSTNVGYFRASGWPTVGGAGPQMQQTPTASPGMNGSLRAMAGDWHPTVLWMIGFMVVEMAAFHVLSRYLKI